LNTSEVVRQAAAGDVITITDRGSPVAPAITEALNTIDFLPHGSRVMQHHKSLAGCTGERRRHA
jgi:antitoxin (DNA-binding transcriptional repressor) of toxin-antitoxin stability system